MQLIESTKEENNLLNELSDTYISFNEMFPKERSFLNSLICRKKPMKILEVGVAAGGGSVIMLNAIKDITNSKLFSVDYSHKCYNNSKEKTGFIVDNYTHLKEKWTIFTGGLVCDFLDQIESDIDLCFVDTRHMNPGELLDTLMILPYLKNNATVVFHDINMPMMSHLNHDRYTNNTLMSALNGDKLIPAESDTIFPNIGAVIIEKNILEKAWNIFNLLTQDWVYYPSINELNRISMHFEKHYDSYCIDMFRKIIKYQNSRKSVISSCDGFLEESRVNKYRYKALYNACFNNFFDRIKSYF